jgi:hypothetical protein
MTTRSLVLSRAALALVMSICLVCGPALEAAHAAQDASATEAGRGSIHGTLYQADQKESLAGAKVTAINVRTGKQYSSEVTRDSGNYDITGLPGGTYDVVIEIAGSVFVADHILDVGQSESVTKSYSVQPQKPANRTIAKLPAPKGSATVVGETDLQPPFWSTAKGKALIGVLTIGAAAAIIYAANNNDDNASPSSP